MIIPNQPAPIIHPIYLLGNIYINYIPMHDDDEPNLSIYQITLPPSPSYRLCLAPARYHLPIPCGLDPDAEMSVGDGTD